MVIRSFVDKTKKVTISLPPALADRLRLAAVGLGVDQGDLVAAGLESVLKGVTVSVSIRAPQPAAESPAAPSGDGFPRVAS